jgi:TPR repeat protein
LLNLLLTVALLSPSAAGSAPAEPWIEVKSASGRLVVVTDAGEKAGRKAALQLAQFDRALAQRFPWLLAGEPPVLTVFASADESMVRSMAPDTTDAEKDNAFSSYLVASTQHVAALRTDLPEAADRDRSPSRGLHRGRVAWLLEQSLGKTAPAWLSRGLVVFLSDAIVKDKEILVGRMAGGDFEGAGTALPAAEFFRDGGMRDRRFDLQAGLFMQLLLVGDNGRNAASLDTLARQIASKAPPAEIQAALAKVTGLYGGFPKHLSARKFQPLKLPTDPGITPAGLVVRPLAPADALMRRAEALFELNRPVDTRGLLRQVKALDPTLVRPVEIEAVLFEREQRSTEAKQAIESAIALGSKNPGLYYRLAQLQWARAMTKPALLSVQKLLENARDLGPDDAGVLAYLAEVQGDLGLAQPALESAQRAAAASPKDVYAQMALARAQWNARKTDPAAATAKQALGLARVAREKQRVQEFLTFAAKNRKAQASGSKPYMSQFGPPPPGAFGATRDAGAGAALVNVGQARTDSADASAITECFAKRDDGACARAVPSLESACGQKQTTSCVSLGSLYDGGFGVGRDRRKAAALYKTACDLADKAGCARLAVLEAQGTGVAQNAARATKTLEALCAEKVPEGCIGLAQVLQRTGFAVDRDRAQALLKSACAAGSAEACGLVTSR